MSVYGLMPTGGELAMIRKYVADATVVFDVGANVGVWTVIMSRKNSRAQVHAFEPNPETFALLERNVGENKCANVTLNRTAVSDTEKQLTFQVPEGVSIYGRVAPAVEGVDKEGRFLHTNSFIVPSVRLDDYCRAHRIESIDFLKIDVEGYELPALKGLESLLKARRIKAIYMETMKENHDMMGSNFSELLSYVSDCGYRFFSLADNDGSESLVSIEQIKAHNHLCLPC
ncbi:MAG: FkbM family methyltransferase [Chthoniobacteraceae bacterium]